MTDWPACWKCGERFKRVAEHEAQHCTKYVCVECYNATPAWVKDALALAPKAPWILDADA